MEMNGDVAIPYNGGTNQTTHPLTSRQRLRWTHELHERFVDAVAQLGGPDSMYFKFCCNFFRIAY